MGAVGAAGVKLSDPHLPANAGCASFVHQAGHVHEAVPLDEHVGRADRLSEADDGAVALVLSCTAASQSTRTST